MTNGNVNLVNGTPVININEPNINGISHNIYSKMDVDFKGAVFNNSTAASAAAAQSQLAGKLAANPNLSTAGAKIILNEIQSNQASQLNGSLEVFGDKARVIIANPSGISCSSCSFIGNTQDVTLTTGTPQLVFNKLNGYRVTQGNIIIKGNLTSNSPTAIISRTAQIQGDLNVTGAEGLTIITGYNIIGSDNKSVQASSGSNCQSSTYGIDMSAFGGMYADKITLISTENGVGIRNSGNITAGTGGLTLSSAGSLINSFGTLQSEDDILLNSNNTLNNNNGTIDAAGNISVNVLQSSLNNKSGVINALQDITISSDGLNNSNGRIAATGDVSINSGNNQLYNQGNKKRFGIFGRNIEISASGVLNEYGRIKGDSISLDVGFLKLNAAFIDASGDIDIKASNYISNTRGRIRSDNGAIRLTTDRIGNYNNKTVDTDSYDSLGIISGIGGTVINTGSLWNSGQIFSKGDIEINASFLLQNYFNPNNITIDGIIKSLGSMRLTADSFDNVSSQISSGQDLAITIINGINNTGGYIHSGNGTLTAYAKSISNSSGIVLAKDIQLETTDAINNKMGLIKAKNSLSLQAQGTIFNDNSSSFGQNGTAYSHIYQEGGIVSDNDITIRSKDLSSNSSRIEAINGNLDIDVAGNLDNTGSQLNSGDKLTLNVTGSLYNSNGSLYSDGDIVVNADFFDNHNGSIRSIGNMVNRFNRFSTDTAGDQIYTLGNLRMDILGQFTNYGTITAYNNLDLRVYGDLTNKGNIASSKGNVSLDVHSNLTNKGTIFAPKVLKLKLLPISTIDNYGTIKASDSLDINAGSLINRNGALISAQKVLSTHNTKITSYAGSQIIYPG